MDTKFITRLEKRVNITNSLHFPLNQVQYLLKEAYSRYYALKKEAWQLHKVQLINLVALQAKYNNEDQVTRYNTMIMYKR